MLSVIENKIFKILLQVACMHGLHMVLQSFTCLKDMMWMVPTFSYILVFYISHIAYMFLNEFLKVVF